MIYYCLTSQRLHEEEDWKIMITIRHISEKSDKGSRRRRSEGAISGLAASSHAHHWHFCCLSTTVVPFPSPACYLYSSLN